MTDDQQSTDDTRLLDAALRQNDDMRGRLAAIEELVADLAQVLIGDRVQPSGRWGSSEEMLRHLLAKAREQSYYAR